MGWHLLETLLQQVGEHSTLVGKLWVTATFVFRFIIVASVGDAVYSDEQSDFNCNTGQPGCENVCFNKFSPISHLRFWAAQIIAVCTPSIVFIVYSAHMLLKVPKDEESEDFDDEMGLPPPDEDMLPPEPRPTGGSPKKGKMGRNPSTRSRRSTRPPRPRTGIGMVRGFANPPGEATEAIEDIRDDSEDSDDYDKENGYNDSIDGSISKKSITEIREEIEKLKKMVKDDEMLDNMEKNDKEKKIKKKIQFVYAVSLLLRTAAEAVFLWLQFQLYGFSVPELFKCDRKPCPNIVDCFVSRPQEKTIFLWFMFVVSALCLLLNIVEIKYLGIKKIVKVLFSTRGGEPVDEEKQEKDKSEDDRSSASGQGSNGSKKSYFRMNPTAPSENTVKAGKARENDSDDDNNSIGFSAIGNQPPYRTPAYPYVHRCGMLLNAIPPPDVEKSYL